VSCHQIFAYSASLLKSCTTVEDLRSFIESWITRAWARTPEVIEERMVTYRRFFATYIHSGRVIDSSEDDIYNDVVAAVRKYIPFFQGTMTRAEHNWEEIVNCPINNFIRLFLESALSILQEMLFVPAAATPAPPSNTSDIQTDQAIEDKGRQGENAAENDGQVATNVDDEDRDWDKGESSWQGITSFGDGVAEEALEPAFIPPDNSGFAAESTVGATEGKLSCGAESKEIPPGLTLLYDQNGHLTCETVVKMMENTIKVWVVEGSAAPLYALSDNLLGSFLRSNKSLKKSADEAMYYKRLGKAISGLVTLGTRLWGRERDFVLKRCAILPINSQLLCNPWNCSQQVFRYCGDSKFEYYWPFYSATNKTSFAEYKFADHKEMYEVFSALDREGQQQVHAEWDAELEKLKQDNPHLLPSPAVQGRNLHRQAEAFVSCFCYSKKGLIQTFV